MYSDEYQTVIDKLNEFISEQPSQEEAAKILGISSSILTPIRKGTYKGDTEKYIRKMADYFNLKADFSDTYREVEYANTSISKKVYDTIRICHVKGGLAVFAGDAGIGKTKAAQKYVADNPNSAVYITLNPCLTSIKSTLKILANAINAPTSSTLDDMWINIVGKLAQIYRLYRYDDNDGFVELIECVLDVYSYDYPRAVYIGDYLYIFDGVESIYTYELNDYSLIGVTEF